MPDSTLDILARISFEALGEEEMKRIGETLGNESNLLKLLQERQKELTALRLKDGKSIDQIKAINTEYSKNEKLIQQLNGQYKEQIGIVNKLQERQRILQEKIASSESRKEIQRLNIQLQGVQRELASINNQSSLMQQTFRNLGIAIGGAFIADRIVQFGKAGVEEFLQMEAAGNALALQLRNFGRERFFDQLSDQADELAAKFKFLDNDDLKSAQAKLVTYGKVSIAQIQQLLPVIIDFAANQRVSIDEATETIIRGLEGQGRAFKQIGVEFKSGATTAQNYAVVMDQVSKKVQGSAADFLSQNAGQFESFRQEIRDTQEELGAELVPMVLKSKESIKDFVVFLGNAGIFLVKNRNIVFSLVAIYALYQAALVRQAVLLQLTTEGTVLYNAAQTVTAARLAIVNAVTRTYYATVYLLQIAVDVLTGKLALANAQTLLMATSTRALALGVVGLLSGVGLLVGAMVLLTNSASGATAKTRELERQMKLNSEVNKRVIESTEGTINKIKQLRDIAANDKSIDNRTKALQGLNIIMGEYAKGLTLENIKTAEGIKITDAYITKIKELSAAKARQALLDEKQLELARLNNELANAPSLAGRNELKAFGQDALSLIGFGEGSTGRQNFNKRKRADELAKQIEILTKEVAGDIKSGNLKVDDLINQILSGGGDTDKSAEQLAEKRFQLSQTLQAKIIDLTKEQNQKIAESTLRVNEETIRKKVEAERDAALKQLDLQEKAAKKENLLTTENAANFKRIRVLINGNANLEIEKQTKEIHKKLLLEQQKFELELQKIKLQNAQESLKFQSGNLNSRLSAIDAETEIAVKEAEAQFEILKQQARELGKDEADVEVEKQQRIFLIRKGGNQKKLDAELDFINQSNELIQSSLETQLTELDTAAKEEELVLMKKFRRGLISQTEYQYQLEKIKRESQKRQIAAQMLAAGQELQSLQNELAKLENLQAQQKAGTAPLDAAFVSDADINGVKNRIAQIRALIAELNKQLFELSSPQQTEFDRFMMKVYRFYDEYVKKAADAANAIYDIQLAHDERLLDAQRRRVDAAKEIADKGGAEVLRKEQDRLQKLEEAQKRHARTQRAIQAALIVTQNALNVAQAVGAVANAAATGDPYSTAGRVAAAVIALAAGIAASVSAVNSINVDTGSGFYTGGYTGDGNPKERAGDVHKQEYVFDHKATKRIGVDTLEKLRNGQIDVSNGLLYTVPERAISYGELNRDYEFVRNSNINNSFDTRKLERKLDAVVEAVNGIPAPYFKADADGIAIGVSGYIERMQKYKNL